MNKYCEQSYLTEYKELNYWIGEEHIPDNPHIDNAFRKFITHSGFNLKPKGKIIYDTHCGNCPKGSNPAKSGTWPHIDDDEREILFITCIFYRGIFKGGELEVYTPRSVVYKLDLSNEDETTFKYVIIRGDMLHFVHNLLEGHREVLLVRCEREDIGGCFATLSPPGKSITMSTVKVNNIIKKRILVDGLQAARFLYFSNWKFVIIDKHGKVTNYEPPTDCFRSNFAKFDHYIVKYNKKTGNWYDYTKM